jgi:hypothetical protein
MQLLNTSLVYQSALWESSRLSLENTPLTHALFYSALLCTALPCSVLHCPALHCPALHCPALHCPALHCPALHCATLHCSALLPIACTWHSKGTDRWRWWGSPVQTWSGFIASSIPFCDTEVLFLSQLHIRLPWRTHLNLIGQDRNIQSRHLLFLHPPTLLYNFTLF